MGGVLPLCREAVGVFYCPHHLPTEKKGDLNRLNNFLVVIYNYVTVIFQRRQVVGVFYNPNRLGNVWFQVFISNSKDFQIDLNHRWDSLTGILTPSLRVPWSNGYERVIHNPSDP